MNIPESITPVFNTLQVHDPNKVTLCVGGAALAAHLAMVGVEVDPQADVDILCSGPYFDELCDTIDSQPPSHVADYKMRLPYGKPPLRALAPVLDVYPPAESKELLPFSATMAMGGTWFPTHYENFTPDSPDVITYRGYRFLSMARLLIWTACSGREKDMNKLDKLIPLAYEHNLLSDAEYDAVQSEYTHSLSLRQAHPERYFARAAARRADRLRAGRAAA